MSIVQYGYQGQDLEARPEYAEVRRLLGIGPDDRTDRPKVGGKVIWVGLRDASPPGGIPGVPAGRWRQSRRGHRRRRPVPRTTVPEAAPDDKPKKKPATLAVHGLVIDATTKRAIPRFRVIPGSLHGPGVAWQPHLIATHRGGRFDLPPNPWAWDQTQFRVEAEGYRPSVSRIVKKSEGEVKLTFALQADAGISAVVRTPDGAPAAGAQVAWATSTREATGHGATITLAVDERFGYRVVTADAEGRIRLPPECDSGAIIVAHDRGYAEIRPADVISSGVVTLRKWCRVEGRVVAGTKPVVGQKVRVCRNGSLSYESPTPSWEAEAITDADGRFACDRVVAGRQIVDRWFPTGDGEGTVSGLGTTIEVREGQVTRVILGGPGRALVGRFEAPKGFVLPIDWTKARIGLGQRHIAPRGDVPLAREIYAAFLKSEGSKPYFPDKLLVDRDGSFRIESVRPAQYHLRIWIDGPAVGKPAETGIHYAIGVAEFQVDPTVNGPSDEPQSLGTITLRPQNRDK